MSYSFEDISLDEILTFEQRIQQFENRSEPLENEEKIAVWMAKQLLEHRQLKRGQVLDHIRDHYSGEYYEVKDPGMGNIDSKVLKLFRRLYSEDAKWSGTEQAWFLRWK